MDFFRKPDPKEVMRQNERTLKKTQRELERDRNQLDRQEKALEVEIRKLAREGNKQGCAVLAKQLVNLRKQKAKSFGMTAKVSAINSQSKAMQSGVKMAGAMKTTTEAMGQMNKQLDPMKVAKTMEEFSKANTKMEMSEELMSETLDSILDESGDEEEQDRIVSQVLDEIGIEIKDKLSGATVPRHQIGESSAAKSKPMTDGDIDRLLASLRD